MKDVIQNENENIVLGILAHVDAGKTTLSERMLFACGAIRRLGRVDHGDSFLDTNGIERQRGITIFSKQARFTAGDKNIVLLDTPGHIDFSAEMERTLQVLDYAILVISGADGVQGHTQTLWNLLGQYHIPTLLFINKMDQEGTDKDEILEQLQNRLSSECIDFTRSDDRDGEFQESLAMADEELLDQFLHQGKITQQDIAVLIQKRKIFPCYFGSALKETGIQDFLQGLSDYLRYPVYPQVFGARIFKITRDDQGNRLTHMKVTGGVLRVKETMRGQAWEKEEKVNQIRLYSGEKFETADEVRAGNICALTGPLQSQAGEGVGYETHFVMPRLVPVLMYQILWPQQMDAHTVLGKLRILEEETPELHISWNEELSQIHALLMGEVQIEVLKSLVMQRFGFAIELGSGNVVYQETITQTVEGVGHFEPLRHYAEVHLILEPLARGSGLVFETRCSQDSLNLNWQRLILTHLREKEHVGTLTGSKITDMKITLAAGRAHAKHTEGGDFRQATYRAVRQGLMQALSQGACTLLEPYYNFRIELPSEMIGRLLTDVQRMSGSFEPPIASGEMTILTGKAPVEEMQDYARELISYTRGRGRISLNFAGYDTCHEQEKVIAAMAYVPERDLDNTGDSVFCEHGSGFVVPWSDVNKHMHLPSALLQTGKEELDANIGIRLQREIERKNRAESQKYGQQENELKAIFERTYGISKRERTQDSRRVGGNGQRDSAAQTQKVAKAEASRQYACDNKKRPASGEEYLLVDGYNIVFAWEELKELAKTNIDAARGRLMDILCNYQGFVKCHLILVFDAYRVKGNVGQVQKYHNIEVVYTKEAETADQYIEKTAHAMGREYHVTVATSDGLEQLIVWGQGCRILSARELKLEVHRAEQMMRENWLE